LRFGQNRICRGQDNLQLWFWVEVDSELGLRRKTYSNSAKLRVTMQTRLAIMTLINPD
jgi:hypothetical protein